jgi:cyclic pyranopterin phosphate synthase
MEGRNTEDIIPLVELTKDLPVTVRFIEEMPFNGDGNDFSGLHWNHIRILNSIKEKFTNIQKLVDQPSSTAYNYQIPNHKGKVGIIAAYTRSFCGTCNRLRLTPTGMLKTCLYDDGVLNIKELLRNGHSDEEIQSALLNTINQRAKDGWEAEKRTGIGAHQSMATIGG